MTLSCFRLSARLFLGLGALTLAGADRLQERRRYDTGCRSFSGSPKAYGRSNLRADRERCRAGSAGAGGDYTEDHCAGKEVLRAAWITGEDRPIAGVA